jgi:hypothetical protein
MLDDQCRMTDNELAGPLGVFIAESGQAGKGAQQAGQAGHREPSAGNA